MTQILKTKEIKILTLVLALLSALWAIDTTQNNTITGYQTADELDDSIPGFVLEKEWNLVGITSENERTIRDIQGKCDLRYAFAYDNAANLRLMLTPTKAAPISRKLEGNAMWLYTKNKCRFNPEATPKTLAQGKRIELNGYNTTAITQDLLGKKISELPGCEGKIEKAWIYYPTGTSEENKYEETGSTSWIGLDTRGGRIPDTALGKGMVIKTKEKCTLFKNVYPLKIDDGDLLRLEDGEEDKYLINGKSYTVKANFVESIGGATFTVNGETTPALTRSATYYTPGSDQYTLKDGTTIRIGGFDVYPTKKVGFKLTKEKEPTTQIVGKDSILSLKEGETKSYAITDEEGMRKYRITADFVGQKVIFTIDAAYDNPTPALAAGQRHALPDGTEITVKKITASSQAGGERRVEFTLAIANKADLVVMLKAPDQLVAGRLYGSPTAGSIHEKELTAGKGNLIMVEVTNIGTASTTESRINKGEDGSFYTIIYLKKDGKIISTIASERMPPLTTIKNAKGRTTTEMDFHDYLNFTWTPPEDLESGTYNLTAVTDTQEAISEAVERISESDETNNEATQKIEIVKEGEVASKRVFITSEAYNDGNLGGLTGADAKCQNLANIYKTGGQWKAWLSTTTVNAKDRIPDTRYVNMKGETIAYSKADLLDYTLKAPIKYDQRNTIPHYTRAAGVGKTAEGELALVYAIDQFAWTGSYPSGKVYESGPSLDKMTPYTCKDWTSSDKNDQGMGGSQGQDKATGRLAGETTSNWATGFAANCDGTQGNGETFYKYRLYCFETG